MNHVLARSDRNPLDFNGPDQEGRSRKAHTLQGTGVHVARLLTLRAGMRMEAMGMKRRGRSCTMIARKMFGFGPGASSTEILTKLNEEIKEFLRD